MLDTNPPGGLKCDNGVLVSTSLVWLVYSTCIALDMRCVLLVMGDIERRPIMCCKCGCDCCCCCSRNRDACPVAVERVVGVTMSAKSASALKRRLMLLPLRWLCGVATKSGSSMSSSSSARSASWTSGDRSSEPLHTLGCRSADRDNMDDAAFRSGGVDAADVGLAVFVVVVTIDVTVCVVVGSIRFTMLTPFSSLLAMYRPPLCRRLPNGGCTTVVVVVTVRTVVVDAGVPVF